jgi:hypothetical protein
MELGDLEYSRNFIFKITKKHCEETGFDVHRIGGNSYPNYFCLWWQELEDAHEVYCNYHNIKYEIEKYGVTEYELYYHKKFEIQVKEKFGKKNLRVNKLVDRINPRTNEAEVFFGDKLDKRWYRNYNIVPAKKNKNKP